jgi:hypothetical protein
MDEKKVREAIEVIKSEIILQADLYVARIIRYRNRSAGKAVAEESRKLEWTSVVS